MPTFDALGVVVPDMAAAVDFYTRLGLVFADGAADEGHVEAALPGGARFMIDTEEIVKSFDPDWTPPSEAGRISLAFLCDDAAGVDTAHAAVTAAGYESVLAPFDAFWGQRYATVLDPAGNRVDLFAPSG